MSTIAKLDPEVRRLRASRRNSRRFFGAHGTLKTDIGIMCIAIHDILTKLKNESHTDGAHKHIVAQRLEAEFEANMARITNIPVQASTPVEGV